MPRLGLDPEDLERAVQRRGEQLVAGVVGSIGAVEIESAPFGTPHHGADLFGQVEEPADGDVQPVRDLDQGGKGRIALASFDLTDEAGTHTGSSAEVVEGVTGLLAQCLDLDSHCGDERVQIRLTVLGYVGCVTHSFDLPQWRGDGRSFAVERQALRRSMCGLGDPGLVILKSFTRLKTTLQSEELQLNERWSVSRPVQRSPTNDQTWSGHAEAARNSSPRRLCTSPSDVPGHRPKGTLTAVGPFRRAPVRRR